MKPQINDSRMLELLHDKDNLIKIDNEHSDESFEDIRQHTSERNEAPVTK